MPLPNWQRSRLTIVATLWSGSRGGRTGHSTSTISGVRNTVYPLGRQQCHQHALLAAADLRRGQPSVGPSNRQLTDEPNNQTVVGAAGPGTTVSTRGRTTEARNVVCWSGSSWSDEYASISDSEGRRTWSPDTIDSS